MLLTASAGDDQTPPGAYDAREHYTKYEYRIPMRDGVRLFTSVLVPKDASTAYPFMIVRTPFGVGPYGSDEYSPAAVQTEAFLKAGYIWVRQDVRGRTVGRRVYPRDPASTGEADPVRCRRKHRHVRHRGVAAAACPQSQRPRGHLGHLVRRVLHGAGIIDTHPAIKAASPQAPVADLFLDDDWYHGGAFMLAANFDAGLPAAGGTTTQGDGTVRLRHEDGYEFFLKLGRWPMHLPTRGSEPYVGRTVAHPTYDEYWQSRAIWRHLKNIRCAVLTVGGWFDAEDLMGPLRVYHAIGLTTRISNSLVMGPWVHGGWARHDGRRLGNVDFAADTAKYYRQKSCFRSSSSI